MSRIGKKPIIIPSGVTVDISDQAIMIKGPKGELQSNLPGNVSVATTGENEIVVNPNDETKLSRALWGTYASLIDNMVAGVTEGFRKKLIIEGVGYRAETQGKKLVMQLGYSHPVEMEIPADLEVVVEKNLITVSGIDKELVGQFAANIRANRKPEPYKGKGIRYENEQIRRKEGKKAA
jgi:large subunit ribosomal protein L6